MVARSRGARITRLLFDSQHANNAQRMTTHEPAVQDFYPEGFSHCLGCGRLNKHGRQFKTRMEGDESVTRFTPQPQDTAVPGFVYGGLIAALIDCHAMATASAVAVRASGNA